MSLGNGLALLRIDDRELVFELLATLVVASAEQATFWKTTDKQKTSTLKLAVGLFPGLSNLRPKK